MAGLDTDLVPARAQRLRHGGVERRLQRHAAPAGDAPARRVGGGLRVLAVAQHAQRHLHMALVLHRSAHDAEGHLRRAVGVHGKGRDDGVRGALARPHLVGVTGFGAEAMAAVLQADAGARHHHAGAKAHVVGLDEGHHHPLGVGRRQVHRAAAPRRAVDRGAGALAVDQRGALAQVLALQQPPGRQRHVVDVGVVVMDIGQRQFHGLDLQVQAVGAVHWLAAHAQLVQHAQRHQGGDALAVGRDFVHHRIAEALRQRAHPVGLVRAQVVLGHGAAAGPRMGGHARGQRATVERLALGGDDVLQRAGMGLAAEQLARPRRPAVGQEALGKARLRAQALGAQRPQGGDGGRDREAVARVVDRRLRQLRQRQPAKAPPQRDPARHGARHGDGVPALVGQAAQAGEVVRRPAGGGAARGV